MSYFSMLRAAKAAEEARKRNDPDILVTDEEFVRIWMENGGSEEKARFHLNLAHTLGISVAIGGKMYRPTDEVPNEPL